MICLITYNNWLCAILQKKAFNLLKINSYVNKNPNKYQLLFSERYLSLKPIKSIIHPVQKPLHPPKVHLPNIFQFLRVCFYY